MPALRKSSEIPWDEVRTYYLTVVGVGKGIRFLLGREGEGASREALRGPAPPLAHQGDAHRNA